MNWVWLPCSGDLRFRLQSGTKNKAELEHSHRPFEGEPDLRRLRGCRNRALDKPKPFIPKSRPNPRPGDLVVNPVNTNLTVVLHWVCVPRLHIMMILRGL